MGSIDCPACGAFASQLRRLLEDYRRSNRSFRDLLSRADECIYADQRLDWMRQYEHARRDRDDAANVVAMFLDEHLPSPDH